MIRKIFIKEKMVSHEKPLICVPAVKATHSELCSELEKLILLDCDVIEWRVDFFKEDILKELEFVAQKTNNKILLFTFRTKPQGGERACEDYFSLLSSAISSGFIDIIDIEMCFDNEKIKKLVELAKANNVKVIISNHYFENTPSKDVVLNLYKEMENLGADIPKIAVMPNDFCDVTQFMDCVYETSKTNLPIIGISMGKLGAITRLCSQSMGSCLTFATGTNNSAPGQLKVSLVKEFLEG